MPILKNRSALSTNWDMNKTIRVTFDVNVTQDGMFSTTLKQDDVDMIKSYGIRLESNRVGREGYFCATELATLEKMVSDVLKKCLDYKIILEEDIISYQIRIVCSYSKDSAGNLLPRPKSFTADYKWFEGNVPINSSHNDTFGFSFYADTFKKKVASYGNGEKRVIYERLSGDEGSNIRFLHDIPCICKCKDIPVQEIKCTEKNALFFVNMFKSICSLNERIKDLIEPSKIEELINNSNHKLLE